MSEQLIWRRKELTEIRAMIDGSRDNLSRRSTLLRAGVALLYAHWEGFIKIAGTYLLEYIAEQRCINADLSPNILSISLRKQLNSAKNAKSHSATVELVEFFSTKMQSRARLTTKGVVDTASNLSSSVLFEILWTLGIDKAEYQTKKILIDERLVNQRNYIAHGEPLSISVDDYLELYDEILALMDTFRNQVENACVNKTFLRVPP
ncbi:MAG: MAE_28990/MAE_18760 family HEPN-like nuclease [Gallionella sp.]